MARILNHRSAITALWATALAVACGCHYVSNPASLWPLSSQETPAGPIAGPPHPVGTPTANPLRITGADREFLWNQLVDTVDDYFQIDFERRVQTIGGVVTEGQIETHYLPGATALEPWRWDSASDFELAYATLQSIRRRASLRVVPVGNGYDVYVAVLKELEDINYPAQVTPGSTTPRYEVSLGRTGRTWLPSQQTLGWLPQGRDAALEQEILREFYGRVYQSPAAGGGPGYLP